jgi:hypothetical protein
MANIATNLSKTNSTHCQYYLYITYELNQQIKYNTHRASWKFRIPNVLATFIQYIWEQETMNIFFSCWIYISLSMKHMRSNNFRWKKKEERKYLIRSHTQVSSLNISALYWVLTYIQKHTQRCIKKEDRMKYSIICLYTMSFQKFSMVLHLNFINFETEIIIYLELYQKW